VETDGLQEKLEQFDKVVESQCPLFKFARDYMKFVMRIPNVHTCITRGRLESPPWFLQGVGKVFLCPCKAELRTHGATISSANAQVRDR